MGARLRCDRPGRHPHRRHVSARSTSSPLVQPRAIRHPSSLSSRWRCSTVLLIDFSKYSANPRHLVEPGGSFALAFSMGGRGGAARRARAWAPVVHPGGAVLQQSVRDRDESSRLALAISASGSAMGHPRGRSPELGLAALPKPGMWMVAPSSRRSASSSWPRRFYYGYEAYSIFAKPLGSIPPPCRRAWTRNSRPGWHALAGRRAGPRPGASRSRS